MTVVQNDVLRMACGFQYTATGDEQINTFHYEKTDATSQSDLDTVDDLRDIAEDMYTHILSSQPTTYFYRTIAIKNITQNLLLGTFGWPTLTVGTGSGVLASAQVAAFAFGRTALSRVRKSVYLGGLQEEDILASAFIAAALTRYENFAIEMIADQSETNGDYSPIAYNAGLDRRTLMVGSDVSITTRTQRRRTVGRGS